MKIYKNKYFIACFISLTIIAHGCGLDRRNIQIEDYIVTEDIDRYWFAYDKVVSTRDTTLQLQYIKEHFIDKASPGQQVMFQVRTYSPQEYVNNINNYPKFWNSIRRHTLKAKECGKEIQQAVAKFKALYPEMKPAKVYFTIGAFRSPGTTLDSLVLIGSEMALADSTVDTSEFPDHLQYVTNYFKTNPIDNVEFLNIHEFVHTQQFDGRGENLLVQCIREGIAEFVAEKASGSDSPFPCISYGGQNENFVKDQFKKEMFNQYYSYWLWSQLENKFDQRDLGYYLGYAMADLYYEKVGDKKRAVKHMIELDLNDEKTVEEFVNSTSFFSVPYTELKQSYLDLQPRVTAMKPFNNEEQKVMPAMHVVTVEFSEEMDKRFRGFEYGPLGEKHVLRIQKYIGFSEDGKSISFEVELEPNKHYQMLLPSRFANLSGTELVPYLIDIRTKK